MTDTKRLRKIIKDKGLTLTYIARELGISRETLRNKIENITEFLPSEINKLCKILDIVKIRDKIEIFLRLKCVYNKISQVVQVILSLVLWAF